MPAWLEAFLGARPFPFASGVTPPLPHLPSVVPDGFANRTELQADPDCLPRAVKFGTRPPIARNGIHRSRNIDRAAIAYPDLGSA